MPWAQSQFCVSRFSLSLSLFFFFSLVHFIVSFLWHFSLPLFSFLVLSLSLSLLSSLIQFSSTHSITSDILIHSTPPVLPLIHFPPSSHKTRTLFELFQLRIPIHTYFATLQPFFFLSSSPHLSTPLHTFTPTPLSFDCKENTAMGSFSNLRSFFSSHLHILSTKDSVPSLHSHDQFQPQSPVQTKARQEEEDYPRFYSIFSELTALERQREQAKHQFPCEERHSFNPHYQHNLVSTSPGFSSPPSLTSSPTDSSPSSSTSSHSSLSRASGARSFGYRSGSYYGQQHHSPQQPQHQPYRHQNSYYNSHGYYNGLHSHGGNSNNYNNSNNGGNYSYHRQYNRRLNQASRSQQQYEYFEDAVMIHQNASTSSSSLSAAPLAASSSSSLASSSQGRQRSVSRATVTFSPTTEVYPHGSIGGRRASSHSSLNGTMPIISESSRISPAMDRRRRLSGAYSESDASSSAAATSSSSCSTFGPDLPSVTVTAATTQGSSSIAAEGSRDGDCKKRMTAHQSLKRIAQVAAHEDGWCSQKAGQYSRQYAETRSRGVAADGRRNRRL